MNSNFRKTRTVRWLENRNMKQVACYLEIDTIARLKAYAAEHDVSMNAAMTEFIDTGLVLEEMRNG